jgi:hypothetical protein
MFRTLTVTAIFALSLTTVAQAEPATDAPTLNSRIQRAAENVCAPLLGARPASLLYRSWFADCVTASAAKITADVTADKHRTLASK